ncbi:glycosyltransferase family 61 protein [Mucilaginibacter sp. X4EP1]|uniref:glycosyltransferase family 61 protein n=1 Tax=Mucilaginibacter sp. X4EP1 TaxID=2723092 RepID=UPI00216A24EE|nr:glycosyltransferase family 61 protein [Mucilaginibacter sp. X4EP1]MCS3811712.1 capsular polysaccharide biosynthesis protein [Mucilaginibacter sp. X4EP1]
MENFKFYIKRKLISILRLSKNYKKRSYLPGGVINFEQLAAQYSVLFLNEHEAVNRKPPVTIGKIHSQFVKMMHTQPQKTFAIAAKNWRVWGNQGAVVTDKNDLFVDVSREFYNKTHSISNQYKLIAPEDLSGLTAVLAASGGTVYYHWMFDILPRISFLKQTGEFDKIDHFIINAIPNKYQTETLERAGIDAAKIIRSNNHWDFHIKAENLLVPSLVSPMDCPSLEACLYLRQLYAKEIENAGASAKIYIQRLSGRKVINEEELLDYLRVLNFKVINPEKLSVAEQAGIFSNADMVIGPHGAGLTNIVFCKPGTIVVDLFAPEWVNPCYWIIAEHLDLKYGYLAGDKELKQKDSGKGVDIFVDVPKLKKLLSALN